MLWDALSIYDNGKCANPQTLGQSIRLDNCDNCVQYYPEMLCPYGTVAKQ